MFFALLACKEDDPAPAPVATVAAQPAAAQPAAAPQPAAQPAAPALEKAVIQAGNNPGGGPRRGIVKQRAAFGAPEVTRLTNGTEVGIVKRIHGGWLEIRWPYPAGTNQGFIHQDVVSMKGKKSQAQR